MTQKELVMKLWNIKSTLIKMKNDTEDVANTLRDWQIERMKKSLKPDPSEVCDAVSLMWYAETIQLARENIARIHDRLQTDMVINEV